ncbi:hypothetical protein SAMD00019534_108060 [Acytostelium subglobosum LB1]|uniref:hypothetical protein n=1 Tax=Acytostelium subglobosum LB1 TaxID=1410327 RepID=UPI000644AD30|nr:hypothetical protein SAMD00019534_108060 [Acytostelium subglobosum LB1]GAM27630.1 hypothetical protein SAMD00019534_108060 [Acytostelium subglobosum LB1]|eukprot:XP_012749289.1 hypothetical protein SAMD00019534_108060 [Acytostelium subglobosum LB1]
MYEQDTKEQQLQQHQFTSSSSNGHGINNQLQVVYVDDRSYEDGISPLNNNTELSSISSESEDAGGTDVFGPFEAHPHQHPQHQHQQQYQEQEQEQEQEPEHQDDTPVIPFTAFIESKHERQMDFLNEDPVTAAVQTVEQEQEKEDEEKGMETLSINVVEDADEDIPGMHDAPSGVINEISSPAPQPTHLPLPFIATPTIAILPDDLVDEPLTLSVATPSPVSIASPSLHIHHVRSFSTPTVTSPQSTSSTSSQSPTTPTSAAAAAAGAKPGFFKRIFRRSESVSPIKPITPIKEDGALGHESGSSSNGTSKESSRDGKDNHASEGFFNTFTNLLSSSQTKLPSTTTTTRSAPPTPLLEQTMDELDKRSSVMEPFSLQQTELFPTATQTISPLGDEAPKDFAKFIELSEPYSYESFLEKLDAAPYFKSSIDSFISKLKNRNVTNDDLREALMDFSTNLMHSLSNDAQWKHASDAEIQFTSLHLQQYVIEKIYDHVFRATEDEVEKDDKLSLMIERLHFVLPAHLEIPSSNCNEQMWQEAGQYLQKINITKSCRHKVMYIVKCCKSILSNLALTSGETHGADSLLPHLIYVVLRTNPQHLQSNVTFISKFSDCSDSEALYYMTQLISVIYFIENIKAESLKIDKKEYNKLMGVTSSSNKSSKRNSQTISKSTSSTSIATSDTLTSILEQHHQQQKAPSLSATAIAPAIVDKVDTQQSRPTVFDDSALATLAEMFPDCNTQYLINCIVYIDNKHKEKHPGASLAPAQLVNRVTNMIAEHQGYLQVNQTLPSSSSSSSTTTKKRQASGQGAELLNPTPSSSTSSSSSSSANTNSQYYQQLLDQKDNEIRRMQVVSQLDKQENKELKRRVLELEEEKQQQQTRLRNSTSGINNVNMNWLTFGATNLDSLKYPDIPQLLEQYKLMYSALQQQQQQQQHQPGE